MSNLSASVHEHEVDKMPFQALRSRCKQHGLSAKGTAEVLRTRLKQEMTAQQRAGVTSNSSNPVADEPHPAVIVARESLTLTQTLKSSEDDTHTVLTSTHKVIETADNKAAHRVDDTADSGEKEPHNSCTSPSRQSMLAAGNAMPLPSQQGDTQATSSGQPPPTGNLNDIHHDIPPTELFPTVKPSLDQKQDQITHSKFSQHWLRLQWPWLFLLLLSALAWQWMKKPMSQSRRSDMGLKCNQQMRFEALSPLLAHSEARGQLAELWSGESQDPYKAGGVLLACSDRNTSSAAAMAVATSLAPSCGHCLHHFDMPNLAAASCPDQGQELAGQAQKALVLLLQQCSHAVVLVEGMESMPPALLPVFINALSEHGHFEESGAQVLAYKALFIATVMMPTHTVQQEQEEDVASRVKQHLVNALVSQGSSDTVSNQAGALRRRFEHAALLS